VSLRSLLRELQDQAGNTRSGLPASVQCLRWSSHDSCSRTGAVDPECATRAACGGATGTRMSSSTASTTRRGSARAPGTGTEDYFGHAWWIEAAFVCADDFGIVALDLAGAPFDGYRDRLQKAGPVDFGSVGLTAGRARLTLRIVGQHERAKPRRMVGLDYVRLLRLE
jgi:hypothetical protein